nr:response regulator [Enterocloster clostridioformis]
MFRIVLCDDSPADLMVLRGHLEQLKEKRPVDIISYTDGLDLLKDYKQKGFCDILVLDMRMKTMGGIEVAKHIRRLDDEVPILIVTATVDYAVEGYKVGAFRYIVKPVEGSDFLSDVEERWTGSRRNRHPSSPSPA